MYRCEDSTFLYAKGDLDGKIYPASITKLFTAYVALLYVNTGDRVTVGAIDLPSGSSTAGLVKGDVLTVKQLLYAMLLPSGNDAARVLATHVGYIISQNSDLSSSAAMEVFISEMNRQAEIVGMTGSHFVNPDGYHNSNHYTCMSDMMLLAKLCLDSSPISQVCATTKYTANYSGTSGGKARTWTNTNNILLSNNSCYIKEAVGLKTGYTSRAGRCLLSAVCIDGEYYIIGAFDCSVQKADSHFQSTCYLYDIYVKP